MKHVRAQTKIWDRRAGYSKRVLVTGDELGFPGILVQELLLEPGQVADEHFHRKQTEIFYFFDTSGEFIVNGQKIDLSPGDALIIEPDDHHEVRCLGSKGFRYVVFKLNFTEGDSFLTASEPPAGS